jgi:hypothetical protein
MTLCNEDSVPRSEYERTLKELRYTADALKAAMHGQRTWVEWDALREVWAYLAARDMHHDVKYLPPASALPGQQKP